MLSKKPISLEKTKINKTKQQNIFSAGTISNTNSQLTKKLQFGINDNLCGRVHTYRRIRKSIEISVLLRDYALCMNW